MNRPGIERLLRQLGELERFERAAGVPARAGRAAWIVRLAPLATAACLLAMLRFGAPGAEAPSDGQPRLRVRSAALEPVSHRPMQALTGGGRLDAFETCARRDGFALVLLRAWNEDCGCLAWRVHEDNAGHRIVQIQQGDLVQLSIDVSENPAVEQMLIFALADRAGELPTEGEATDQLLACLNSNAPPDALDGGGYAGALEACLPDEVRVLTSAFTVE